MPDGHRWPGATLEIALHLILKQAAFLLDDVDGEHVAADHGLPTREAFTVRHRQFAQMRETFLQDDDFTMFYDATMADISVDPDHVAMQYLHVGDIRPPSWWWTFSNLRPREAGRGFDPQVIDRLRATSPALRFTAPTQPSDYQNVATDQTDTNPALPAGLAQEFELFVGLAQRRFFDRRCAVAMARSLARLLTAFLDSPDLNVHRVWMLRERAIIGQEMLIVDEDFCIDGTQPHVAVARGSDRLSGSVVDAGHARRLLRESRTPVRHRRPGTVAGDGQHHTAAGEPDTAATLAERSRALGRTTTLAGFLRHRRHALGLDTQ